MSLETDILQNADIAGDMQSIPAELQDLLLEYVDKNCCDSALCLNAVADHLNISIYAVSRTFKDRTGIGFKEYVTGKRLQRACELLASTGKTVSEISSQCGFENATYFTTVFKREYGIPPSRYRTVIRHMEKTHK